MKKLIKIIAIVSVVFAASTQAMAQERSTKQILKERQQIAKMSKKGLSSKASKTARKEAKKLTKDGWKVAPGALPMDKQLDRSYQMQYEFDENLFPKYIMGDALTVGENYDAAKMQALELAKLNLAGQIQTEITMLIETTVANRQMAAGDAASIVESVGASKNLISQSIGRVIPVVEMYRDTKNKNKEVRVYIAYNSEMAREAVKQAVRQDLEKKGNDLHKKLDNLLGF